MSIIALKNLFIFVYHPIDICWFFFLISVFLYDRYLEMNTSCGNFSESWLSSVLPSLNAKDKVWVYVTEKACMGL